VAITIDYTTHPHIIQVPQADLTLVSGSLYSYDVNVFRLALRALEDDVIGMAFPHTHDHNEDVTVGGILLVDVVIINFADYFVEFEDLVYTVRLEGANHNIADEGVIVHNQVSVITQLSAGLVGVDPQSIRDAMKLTPTAGDPGDGSIDWHLDNLDPHEEAAASSYPAGSFVFKRPM